MYKSEDESLSSKMIGRVSTGSKECVNEALIPGLPDDVALICLAKVSHGFHGFLKCVCKRWRDVVGSEAYVFCKSRMGCCGDWLFVMTGGTEGRWNAYDPKADRWHPIPRMPSFNGGKRFGFSCVSVCNRFLVIGGASSDPYGSVGPRATNRVLSFDPFRQEWSEVASMSTPRMFFACGVICGKVYVAGGHSLSGDPNISSSAEVYDPINDRWEDLPALPARMDYCFGISYNSKFYVMEYKFSCFDREIIQAFSLSPHDRRWRSQWDEWQKPMKMMDKYLVINGHLYIVKGRYVGNAIQTFNAEYGGWHYVGSVPEFPHLERSFGRTVCGLRNTLYIIGGSPIDFRQDQNIPYPDPIMRAVRYCHISTTPLQWRETSLVPRDFRGCIDAFGSLEELFH